MRRNSRGLKREIEGIRWLAIIGSSVRILKFIKWNKEERWNKEFENFNLF
jgi:hypothetical protein